MKCCISLVLTAGVQRSLLNLNALNGVIATFAFSPLEGNKPVALQRSGGTVCVGGTASEVWTLLRFLLLLLSEANSGLLDAPESEVLRGLIVIVQYAVSPVLFESDLVAFEKLVSEWLTPLTCTFVDFVLTPKFHYLLHYASQIRKHGPLRCCWTMRFEGKHQNLKSFLARSKNNRNVCKTIASRHQRFIAVRHNAPQPSAVSSRKSFSRKNKASFPVAVQTLVAQNGHPVWKSVTHMNTEYTAGNVILVKRDDTVVFCRILCVCSKDDDVQFVVRYCGNSDLSHVSCVELEMQDQFESVRPECLADYLPLACYSICEKELVVLKHKLSSNHVRVPS